MAKNATLNQAQEFFKKLSGMQKAVIGIVTAAVLIGLIWIFSSAGKMDMAPLYSELEQKDAAAIAESLKEQNIEYRVEDGGTTIYVPKEKVQDLRLTFAAEGLPESSTVGYEIFDETNLGMSEFVQKLNYRRALEGELARTINSMEEVKRSRVHIVIPEKALFEKDQKEPTASVTLQFESGRSISRMNVEGIQNLVASSIEGMNPANVTVVNNRGKILSETPLDETSIAGKTAKQYEQQRYVEMYLSNKVQSLLDGVLGVGNSEVRINADLDFTAVEKTIKTFDSENPVVRSMQTVEDTQENIDSVTNTITNITRNESSSSSPYINKESNSKRNEIINYEISDTIQRIVHSVGTIERLSVAALINGTYNVVDQEGQKSLQYAPRKEEEMDKLREIIKNSLGYDPERNDQISVLNVPFETVMQEKDIDEYMQPPWWQKPEIQRLLLLAFIALLAVFILYRLMRSRYIKEKVRVAMGLPEHAEVDEDLEPDEELEDIEIPEDDMLLLPAELPEQLLLEGERDDDDFGETALDESGKPLDKEALAQRAKATLDESPEISEEQMMKLELKDKVQEYLASETDDAVKLVRMFLAEDMSEARLGG